MRGVAGRDGPTSDLTYMAAKISHCRYRCRYDIMLVRQEAQLFGKNTASSSAAIRAFVNNLSLFRII